MINRIYRIMEAVYDGEGHEYVKVFEEFEGEVTADTLEKARELKKKFEPDYDNQLVIVEETQIVLE